MARTRKELGKILKTLFPEIKNFYFSPPQGKQMSYPCVVYKIEGDRTIKADNLSYIRKKRYSVTIIDENPDSEYSDRLVEKFGCSLDRAFTSENLNHFIHTIYF